MKPNCLALLFLGCCLSIGCAGGGDENPGGSSTENPDDNSSTARVDPPANEPEKPNPNLRRDGINVAILQLNVDGAGSEPEAVAREIVALNKYHVVGLSSVDKPKVFEDAIKKEWPKSFDKFVSKTGKVSGDPNQHLMILYDYERFYLVSKTELDDFNGVKLSGGNYPSPLVAHLRDNIDDKEFMVVLAHFSEDDPELRQQQANGIRDWASKKSEPIVVIGNLNFEFNVAAEKGNKAFDDFQKDGVFKWVKPMEWNDTTWRDSDGDGKNDLAGMLSDFAMVSGRARGWPATCRVLTRSRDFPDDEKSTNHRPVELILDTKK